MLKNLLSDCEGTARGIELIYSGIKTAHDCALAHDSATDRGVAKIQQQLNRIRDEVDQLVGLLVAIQTGSHSHVGLGGRCASPEVESGSF